MYYLRYKIDNLSKKLDYMIMKYFEGISFIGCGEDTQHGSVQKDLWGFNIYFRASLEESLEFTSLINVRPADGNASLLIKDPALKKKISDILQARVDWSR